MGSPLLRADLGDRGRARRRRGWHRDGQPGTGPLAAVRRRSGRAAIGGRRGDRRARPRSADPRVHLQHAPPRQVDRRSPPVLQHLDLQPQPRERSQRRVGRRIGVGRGRPLRHPPALVPVEGRGARSRPPRRLRPHGRRGRRRPGDRLERGHGRGARCIRVVLTGAGVDRRPVHRGAMDRRADPTRQAAGRLLRLHGALPPPLRAAQLDLEAPRRIDPGPRARPWGARVPRSRAGDLPSGHARSRWRRRRRCSGRR